MRRKVLRIFGITVILAGIGLLIYPYLADAFNRRFASHIAAGYENVIDSMSKEEIDEAFEKAYAFNRDLKEEPARWELPGDLHSRYYETLDVSGTGILGTVYVPRIGVHIPVYHGDDDAVLQVAAGHMEGSSFPTGEPGSHAVIAAHTGMASAKLFTELTKVKEGDLFAVRILDRTLYFRVTGIHTVLPKETELLAIPDDKGQVTLVTCTPFGVNSHRLLVTGTFTDEEPPDEVSLWRAPGFFTNRDLAVASVVLALSVGLFYTAKKKKRKR